MPPIQIHHSVTDEEVPYRFGQTLADEMKQTGQTYEFYSYPGANHAFMNRRGARYHAQADRDSWPKALAFFEKQLGR